MSIARKGRASKRQVAGMVKTLLGLKKPPEPEDVTDALALAISHIHAVRSGRKLAKF
jgi:crossover junction endodeoxyribonuclease RuvC